MLAWGFLLSAVGLGIAYAAAPGAVNTEALRHVVTHEYVILGEVLDGDHFPAGRSL